MAEAIIDGTVQIEPNRELCELLREHNALLKHQNTILSNILDTLKWRQ